MKVAAIIFDLDGTILANEKQYGQAFTNVLKELGVDVDEEYPHISGIGVKENWPILIDKHNIKTEKSLEELEKLTRDEYEKLLNDVKLQEGFEDFIRTARQSGYLTALATSNIWIAVEKVFDVFDIEGFFDVITTSEEVDEKKPNPAIFLTTSQKLGVAPKECLVFEDAEAGIQAARSASMSSVGVARDDRYGKKLKNADLVIKDFTEISIENIKNL